MQFRFLFVLALSGFIACQSSQKDTALKDGDHVFLVAKSDGLSDAINQVTPHDSVRNYSHQGIILIKAPDTLVWHSAPGKGVVCEPIDAFRKDDNGNLREMHVYRLPDTMQKHLPVIWKRANVLLGQPYNETYIMEDSGMYCSEFVYALYSTYPFFKLEPMTFKDPETGETPQAWIDHYSKLGLQIPEGKPGCNPNQMAKSPYFKRVR